MDIFCSLFQIDISYIIKKVKMTESKIPAALMESNRKSPI